MCSIPGPTASCEPVIKWVRHIPSGWWLSHPSEKYNFVSWDDDIPNLWKNNKCSKPPTSILLACHPSQPVWLRYLISCSSILHQPCVQTFNQVCQACMGPWIWANDHRFPKTEFVANCILWVVGSYGSPKCTTSQETSSAIGQFQSVHIYLHINLSLSLYIYIYLHISVYICACMCAYICVYICVCIYIYMCVCVRMCVCTCVYMQLCVYHISILYTYVYMCMCNIHIYIYMCVCAYLYQDNTYFCTSIYVCIYIYMCVIIYAHYVIFNYHVCVLLWLYAGYGCITHFLHVHV